MKLFLLSTLLATLCTTGIVDAKNYTASSQTYSTSGAYGTNFFIDSSEAEYDGYQQAWRYLGWYVECGNPSDRYSKSGSHDSNDDDGDYQANNWCQRYLMWAMYVDPNYSGGGIGEYSFFDYSSNQWDESACSYHGNGRCAQMDCHDEDTETWELLGVFKEATYFGNDAFFEQLFKHEGVCVWNNEDTYEFMSQNREDGFSEGCLQSTVYDQTYGSLLYIDLKPTFNGNMSYALYTDEICKTEYDGMDVSVETVAANMGMLYGKYLQQWNDALEVFKVCQPCMAYNLQKTSSSYNSNNNNYGYNKYKTYSSYRNFQSYYNRNGNNANNNGNYNNDDQIYGENSYNYNNDPNEGYFVCEDDADYTNVNQCMKFRTHADLEVANWEDLVRATNQGGILQIEYGGTLFGSERITREEELYWEEVRKIEIQKEKAQEAAEKAAQDMALRMAREDKTRSFQYMFAGFVALGIALVAVVCGPKDQTEQPLSEPLFDKGTSSSSSSSTPAPQRDLSGSNPGFKKMFLERTIFKNVPAFPKLRASNSEVV